MCTTSAIDQGAYAPHRARQVQNVREITTHHVWFCEEHMRSGATQAASTGTVVPILIDVGKLLLLWGAVTADEADDSYSESPLASAYSLIEQQFAR